MDTVEAHYAKPGLSERVREAIRQSGLDPDRLQQSDFAGRDQFHIGGADATDAMARLVDLRKTDLVLDLGSGIGGTTRHLAATIGCRVEGIDLTEEYCQVSKMLAVSTGLSHLVSYRRGDALATPFEDQSFDVVWTQHASMNIEDKSGLYREMARLLKSGGRLAVHDIVAGTGEVRFPVPWASRPDFSFLTTAEEMQRGLTAAGFRNLSFTDVTKEGIEALRKVAAGATSRGFGIQTLIGPDFPQLASNLVANLLAGTCRVVQSAYTNK
jgi:ubiquinone/menaquinone biosynthesis C-methylase UbiE